MVLRCDGLIMTFHEGLCVLDKKRFASQYFDPQSPERCQSGRMGLIDKTALPFWTHAVRPQGEERSDESNQVYWRPQDACFRNRLDQWRGARVVEWA